MLGSLALHWWSQKGESCLGVWSIELGFHIWIIISYHSTPAVGNELKREVYQSWDVFHVHNYGCEWKRSKQKFNSQHFSSFELWWKAFLIIRINEAVEKCRNLRIKLNVHNSLELMNVELINRFQMKCCL